MRFDAFFRSGNLQPMSNELPYLFLCLQEKAPRSPTDTAAVSAAISLKKELPRARAGADIWNTISKTSVADVLLVVLPLRWARWRRPSTYTQHQSSMRSLLVTAPEPGGATTPGMNFWRQSSAPSLMVAAPASGGVMTPDTDTLHQPSMRSLVDCSCAGQDDGTRHPLFYSVRFKALSDA